MGSVKRGKQIVVAIIAISIILEILSSIGTLGLLFVSGNMSMVMTKLLSSAVRLGLSCALYYCLYKGQTWAKWVISILMIVAGVMTLSILLSVFSIMLLILGLLYTSMGLILCISRSVKQFLDSQSNNGIGESVIQDNEF